MERSRKSVIPYSCSLQFGICCTWDTLIFLSSARMVYLCPNNSNLYAAGNINSSEVHASKAASMWLQNNSCTDFCCCNSPPPCRSTEKKIQDTLLAVKKNKTAWNFSPHFCPFSWPEKWKKWKRMLKLLSHSPLIMSVLSLICKENIYISVGQLNASMIG